MIRGWTEDRSLGLEYRGYLVVGGGKEKNKGKVRKRPKVRVDKGE